MIRWFTVLFLICSAQLAAAQNTVTPQIGGGISFGFDGGIGGNGAGSTVCGGYIGPGDVASGAIIGVSIRAWTAVKCGSKFANVCVSGVCADMLTSSTTGALVPQLINGTTCPAASTTICIIADWYDQQISNACSGSCDMVPSGANQRGILTTTCPLPLTACVLFPVSGGTTVLQAAGNTTLVTPFTASTFASFSGPGTGANYSTIFNSSGTIAHNGSANQLQSSCDGSTFYSTGYTDGSWVSGMEQCTASVMGFFLNGAAISSNAWTPTSTAYPPLVGAVVAGASISMTEMGIWPRDVSSNAGTLYNNQKVYYGLQAPLNSFWDSVAGLDTNNCATSGTACQTGAKMKSLSYPANAVLNWKGASGFTGCLAISATGGSPGPVTIQQYSTGASPSITANCGGANVGSSGPKTAAIILDSLAGTSTINGITVRGSGFVAGSATQYGIVVQNSGNVARPTYIIENNDISGFGVVGLTGSSDQGADIAMFGFSEAAGFPTACGNMNVTVINNTLHGTSTTSGENNGFFPSGCGGGSQAQHVQGNLIFNISGLAGNPGGANGGFISDGATTMGETPSDSYIKFTLAHDLGGNSTTCGGSVGLWVYQMVNGLMQFNEVYNVQGSGGFPGGGACDFSCYDFDINAWSGLAQYIYGHNCGGPGFAVYDAFTQDTIRYSIFENTASYNEDGGGSFSSGSGGTFGAPGQSFQAYNLTIFNNYVPGTSTPPSCLSLGFGNSYTGGLWANNACYNAVQDTFGRTYMVQGNSAGGAGTITMKNNDYFNAGGVLTFAAQWPSPTTYAALSDLQAGTGQEANSNTITPGFTSPPTGNCTWTPSSQATWPPSGCPSAYSTLAVGLKSAGANLASTDPIWFVAPQPTTAGTRGYFGETIPGSGSCYNMGAYGVCP